MTWWCSATRLPWDWSPRAYPGVWLAMAGLMTWYVLARRRLTPEERAAGDRRRPLAFAGGWLALWVATDWPLGALGSGYLASAHMVQYLLYTQVAAPLLVLGLDEPMLRHVLARTRTTELVRLLCRPVAAAVLFNAVLIATHAPVTVDALRASQMGSFVLDGLWLLSGLILWLPVCGPLDEMRPSYPVRAVLLFVGAGVVPMIPGGFLTFADTPLYGIYELAPRVGGFDAGVDQQLAGALMKVGNVPLLWPAIGVLFARWARESGAATPAPPTLREANRSA
jgi:putative membrane protein